MISRETGKRRTAPRFKHPRLDREYRTVRSMIHLYCRKNHRTASGLCGDCAALPAFAEDRLRRCPYGPAKPACSKCDIHCYAPAMRRRIRDVMRYSGPRMIWTHPVLSVRHVLER